jgi:hypothetical protein
MVTKKKTTGTDGIHSDIGPSSAKRFMACKGSVSLIKKNNLKSKSSVHSATGTVMHEIAAICLEKNMKPEKFIDTKSEVDGFKIVITKEMTNAVQVYLDEIDNLLKKHTLNRSSLQIEMYHKMPEIDKDAGGTTDISFIGGDTLYVIDLKGGVGVVIEAVENPQLMYYAIRPLLDAGPFIRKVKLMIIQPRAKTGDFIKEWETTPARIRQFIEELKEAIKEVRSKNPSFCAGEHCSETFCPAMPICLEVQGTILHKVESAVPAIAKVFPIVTAIIPEQLGNALPALYLLKEFLNRLEDVAFELAKGGVKIPNHCLTRSKKNRVYKDENTIEEVFYGKYKEAIFDKKLKSVAQLEKVVGKAELEPYVYTPEGDLKFTMEKHVKDQIKEKLEDMFSSVPGLEDYTKNDKT